MELRPGIAKWVSNVRIAEDGEPGSHEYLGAAPTDLADRTQWARAQVLPLATFAALRAIDVTQIVDGEVRIVRNKGVFYYDSVATGSEVLPNLVAPTVGPGFWRLCGREPGIVCKAMVRPHAYNTQNVGSAPELVDPANRTWGNASAGVTFMANGGMMFTSSPSLASAQEPSVLMDLTSIFAPFGGLSLSQVALFLAGGDGAATHAAIPLGRPKFAVVRSDLLGANVCLASTGWAVDGSASVGNYNAKHTIVFTPDQNQIIDPTKYAYQLVLEGEYSTNGVAFSTVFYGLEFTFA